MRSVVLVGVLGACSFSRGLTPGEDVDAAAEIDAAELDAAACTATPIECPTGYVYVPNNCEYDAGDFCMMKYEAKQAGTRAQAVASGVPWGSITVAQAKIACEMNGAGYHLATNDEWMATARAIEATPENWSTTATPFLSKGKTDNCGPCTTFVQNCPGPASADTSPCHHSTAGCTDRSSTNFRFNRTHRIGSAVIWDFSGSSFELVDHPPTTNAMQGSWPGADINTTDGSTFAPPLTDNQYKSANLAHRDAATQITMVPQSEVENIGLLYVTDPVVAPNFTRGGDYCGFAGIYAIALLRDVELGVNVGFRCAYTPP